FLRGIGNFNLGKVDRDLIDRHNVSGGAAGLIVRNQQVAEFDLQILLLLFACLAARQQRLFDVLTGGTGQEQLGAGLVHVHREIKVLDGNLARPATATVRVRTAIDFSPAPALNINLVFVFGISAFAWDAVDLQ